MTETIPEDVEKLLARLHATAEELANIEHFEGWVPGCDYEPIFKGSTDLLDARDKIAALMAQRAHQEERVRVLEEALRPFNIIAGELFARNFNRKDKVYSIQGISPDGFPVELSLLFEAFLNARAALGNGGGDA